MYQSATQFINNNIPLYILSGEGEMGTRQLYTGKRTIRAIKLALTKERCNGDRWATLVDEHYQDVDVE